MCYSGIVHTKSDRQKDERDRPVRDPAPHRQRLDAIDRTGRVDVRQVRRNNQRRHREPGPFLETELTEYRADEAVRQVVHPGL